MAHLGKKIAQRKFCRKTIITFRVFGVIPSYLVSIELIGDLFRKTLKFDRKIFFPMKNFTFASNFLRFFEMLKFVK